MRNSKSRSFAIVIGVWLLVLFGFVAFMAFQRPLSNEQPLNFRDFRLSDGTRCVSVSDVAVSCNWNAP